LAFPKSQRGVLARELQTKLFVFYEQLVSAAMSEDPQQMLRRADATLSVLRTYLRLSKDLNLLSLRQYGHGVRLIAEVGRLLGGWRGSLSTGRARPS
jgi:hypothetical protein